MMLVAALCALLQLGGEVTGDSPFTAGMAGAGASASPSLLDASRNPSGLSWLFEAGGGFPAPGAGRDLLLDLNLRLLGASGEVRNADGVTVGSGTEAAIGPWFGLGARWGERWTWSLALQPTAGGASDVVRTTALDIVTVNPDGSGGPAPHDVRFRSDLLQLSFEPSLAYRASEQWSFGIGLSLRETSLEVHSASGIQLSELRGAIDPGLAAIFGEQSWGELILELGEDRGLETFQAEFEADADSDVLMSMLRLGASWQPEHRTRVGFWYRPPSTRSDLDGKVFVDLAADLGAFVNGVGEILGETLLEDPTSWYDFRVADMRMPQQAGIAASRILSERHRLHATLMWTDWSGAFEGWQAELSNPSNPEFLDYLGGDGSTTLDLDVHWRDTLALSVGWEWDPSSLWTLRVGGGWAKNPLGGSVFAGLAPFNRWHVGCGASWWGSEQSRTDWHLGLVVALPESYESGENEVLDDFSGDEFDQWTWSLAAGCTIAW